MAALIADTSTPSCWVEETATKSEDGEPMKTNQKRTHRVVIELGERRSTRRLSSERCHISFCLVHVRATLSHGRFPYKAALAVDGVRDLKQEQEQMSKDTEDYHAM